MKTKLRKNLDVVAAIFLLQFWPGAHAVAQVTEGEVARAPFKMNLEAAAQQERSSNATMTPASEREEQSGSPNVLRRPLISPLAPQFAPPAGNAEPFYQSPFDAPLGYTGKSSVFPSVEAQDNRFIPREDRWRIGMPEWDRYGKGNPYFDDQPYEIGHWWDSYNQNVLKGDFPIIGQHTFLNVIASSASLAEVRQFPIGTTPFESTARSHEEEFFGRPNNVLYTHYLKLATELSHGDAGFKPADWRIRLTPVFNLNYLDTNELAVVNPNVTQGTQRIRTQSALEEFFAETKLSDNSPYYDFTSLRVGSQFFNSDFRGFIFSDTNLGARLFGTRNSNRQQFNIVYFDQLEKETNSELNTFRDRNQNVLIGNYYYQDFIFPGYTAQWSVHFNHDSGSMMFDRNDNLVRPDPAGVFQQHDIDTVYLGFAGDGHIGRYNISHAFYWVLGRDDLNPIANKAQSVNAQMAAVELSYDRDWMRFRTSFMWASGDNRADDTQARGFDAIFDNPNFAGGEFSYWQRQSIRLFGVNLVQRQSLIPDLRSSKSQGQVNYVNPGLVLLNAGIDMDLTPKLKSITNVNSLWFDKTNSLETFTFDGHIDRHIGIDISTGLEYRPFLNNNVIITTGVAALVPGSGFRDLFNDLTDQADTAMQGFLDIVLTY